MIGANQPDRRHRAIRTPPIDTACHHDTPRAAKTADGHPITGVEPCRHRARPRKAHGLPHHLHGTPIARNLRDGPIQRMYNRNAAGLKATRRPVGIDHHHLPHRQGIDRRGLAVCTDRYGVLVMDLDTVHADRRKPRYRSNDACPADTHFRARITGQIGGARHPLSCPADTTGQRVPRTADAPRRLQLMRGDGTACTACSYSPGRATGSANSDPLDQRGPLLERLARSPHTANRPKTAHVHTRRRSQGPARHQPGGEECSQRGAEAPEGKRHAQSFPSAGTSLSASE